MIEAKNEAQTILEAVQKGEKHPAWQQLSFNEIQEIKAAVLELEASVKGGDYKIIRRGIDTLDKATRRFAELMMDSAVSSALTGQTMERQVSQWATAPARRTPLHRRRLRTQRKTRAKISAVAPCRMLTRRERACVGATVILPNMPCRNASGREMKR